MPLRDKYSKRQIILQFRNIFLVLLGCAVLAFADAAFIVPTSLLTGGIASIAVIVQFLVGSSFQVADIVTAGLTVVLFLVGLFVLGKRFSAHTLLASLAYPAFFALFYRTDMCRPIYESFTVNFPEPYLGYFLCGVLGGFGVGAGVAITFLGDGSTGGLDILSVIIAKFTPIKESISTFVVDATIVITGIIVMRATPNIIPLGIFGIMSAGVCALAIQLIYVSANSSFYVVEIISEQHKLIVEFIEDELLRGCTVFYAEGGYKGDKKMVVKAAVKKAESRDLRAFIAKIDPKAFLIVYPSATVNGEGFVAFASGRTSLLRQFFQPQRDLKKWDSSSNEK